MEDVQNNEQSMTINELSQQLLELKEAMQEARHKALAGDYSDPKFAPLIEKMERKVPSLGKVILPPFLKKALGDTLKPLVKRAERLKDRYIPMLLEDLDEGRTDRIIPLLWLAYLNILRLSYGGEYTFAKVREYVISKYNDDIADPNGHTTFLPERDETTEEVWCQVDKMIEDGLVMIRETIRVKDPDGETRPLTIITMSEKV